jgi:hypothetical protein
VSFSFDKASKSSEISQGTIPGKQTNHSLYIVDAAGNAV